MNLRDGVTNRKDESNKRRFSPQLWEPKHVRPDSRLVTIYTELRRSHTNIAYNLSLYWNAQCDVKQTVVWYLTNYIQFLVVTQQIAYREYIQLSRMSKTAGVCVPFPASFSLRRTSFCIIFAVIGLPSIQLVEIYVDFMQFQSHHIVCRFVRLFACMHHINVRCKQKIDICRT